ncbi:MAG: DUF4255 domain-containing protein, partial [Caldilineaceae bacterium]|nr:DUF4255 domain-containing protein [Caldilineaceae bacterium]
MSNFLAPATVTAALKIALENALAADPSGLPGVATIGRPDEIGTNGVSAGVNIYLYQVTPNVAWRNADLPTRTPRGTLQQRPRAALDLHYLLTFFGAEATLEDQRLMGHVVSMLHDQPILTPAMIEAAVAHEDFEDILGNSDLTAEVERVKFSPLTLNLEELSKLWSIFFQTPYHLSMAYMASVVFIERQPAPTRALPVLVRKVRALPSSNLPPSTTPDRLPDLQLWLQSDAGITADSDGVSRWTDLSGNGHHAEQAAIGRRPAFVAHGLGQYPVLRFDGNDDRLAIQGLNYSTPLNGVTVCAVVRSTNATEQTIISFDSTRYWSLALSNGDAPALIRWQTTDATTTHDLASPHSLVDPRTDGRWHLVCATYDATATSDKQLFVDGEQIAEENAAHSGNPLGTGARRFGFVGAESQAATVNGPVAGTGFFAGELAELLLYNRALSNAERDHLE